MGVRLGSPDGGHLLPVPFERSLLVRAHPG